MYDIIIVGAGPAGLTAALYARRANKKVLVFDAKSYGGQIINAYKVENYPGIKSISGYDYATNLYEQVKELGAEFKFECVDSVTEKKEVITKNGTYKAKAIILAPGAENRKLNLESEEKFIGRGVSYCATCDGNFYKNKSVAVIGGGNTALTDAIYLSNIANTVYLIHRRDSFRGEQKYIEELKNHKNIKIYYNSRTEKLNGNDKLESIDIIENSNKINLKIDGLFVAIGQKPSNEIFSNVAELDSYGYFITEDGVHTKTSGIYVAGDAREKTLRQLTTAVSDGSIAATVAIDEIK